MINNAKAHFGTIDIVVPNAGYEGKPHPVQDMTLDLFEQTYMLNVFSVMLMMKYAALTLIEKQSQPHGVESALSCCKNVIACYYSFFNQADLYQYVIPEYA